MWRIGTPPRPEQPRSFFAAAAEFRRRHLFVWLAAVLLANQLFAVLGDVGRDSIGIAATRLAEIGVFPFLAWCAVFRLLGDSRPLARANRRDLAVAVALCVLLLLPTSRMIWAAASLAAAYLALFHAGDLRLRAAGVVLAALAFQQLWAHLLFDLVAFDVLRGETALVGLVLQATQDGIQWQDNLITAPDGHGIAVYASCSSFHNVSLALLGWVTLTKLRRPSWERGDFLVGALAVAVMILLNLLRLYLMAINVDLFRYWHEGAGAQIFAAGASIAILTICLYGANRGARRA